MNIKYQIVIKQSVVYIISLKPHKIAWIFINDKLYKDKNPICDGVEETMNFLSDKLDPTTYCKLEKHLYVEII